MLPSYIIETKIQGSSATEAYPWGTLQGDERLRTTLGVILGFLLDSLACHQQIRIVDRIDFFHRHIELKGQLDQVPL